MRRWTWLILAALGLALCGPALAKSKKKDAPPPAAAVKAAPCIDVEEASAKELTALKGVAEVLAKRIIDYRAKERTAATKASKPKWNFHNWATLMKVSGIGPKVCEDNITRVCFGGKPQKACPK